MTTLSLYSVPFWQTTYPDFEEEKEKFLKVVQEYKQEHPEAQNISNVGGYQTEKFIHSKEELNSLFSYIHSFANYAADELNFVARDTYITSSWANIGDSRQSMHTEHTHGDVFSGVFFLNTPEKSGNLCIRNIATNSMWMGSKLCQEKNQFTSTLVKISPVEGEILLWPSYLPHAVETNDHDDVRISISFDIIMIPKPKSNQDSIPES
jgi:uncharacterized protein (TIGR02466 family)